MRWKNATLSKEKEAAVITPQDDLLHPRNHDPYWNESACFMFQIPERKIHAWMYVYHRPNMMLSAGGPAIWDPSGDEPYTCLYYDWDTCQPMPPDAEMLDFTLQNGFSIETVELGSKYALRYESEDCTIDLQFETIVPPQEMQPVNGQINQGIADWLIRPANRSLSVGHYESVGRYTGNVRLRGVDLAVDCFGLRDRTWGPRRVTDAPRVGYMWGNASESASFLACAPSELSCEDDPFIGTIEAVSAGWYVADGVLAPLVSGERRVVKRGADGRPLVIRLDAVDSRGRGINAEGMIENTLKWTGYGRAFSFWSLAHWRWNGNEGYGESLEYFTFNRARRFHEKQTIPTSPSRAGSVASRILPTYSAR
jgi:hypothetical protein